MKIRHSDNENYQRVERTRVTRSYHTHTHINRHKPTYRHTHTHTNKQAHRHTHTDIPTGDYL